MAVWKQPPDAETTVNLADLGEPAMVALSDPIVGLGLSGVLLLIVLFAVRHITGRALRRRTPSYHRI